MSNTQPTRRGWKAPSIIPLMLIASIGVAVPAHAQSPGVSSAAAPVKAQKDATSKRTTAAAAPGPFTYDAVGATPKVRKPGQPGVSSPGVKTTASPNATGSEKAPQPEPLSALSR